MNDELATDALIAYGVATSLPRYFSELIDALEDESDPDSIAGALDGLRLQRSLIELCSLDDPDCAPLIVTSVADLRDAKDTVTALVYEEYLPKIMAEPPQLAHLNVMSYLDGAIAYGDAYLSQTVLSQLQTQSAKMTLTPAVRLDALRKLPLEALANAKTRLDLVGLQRAVEEVVAITDTETFEPPSDFMQSSDSPEEAERNIRTGLQALVEELTIDFASDASRPNPLRTSASYLLAYCKVGQEMSAAQDLDISPEL